MREVSGEQMSQYAVREGARARFDDGTPCRIVLQAGEVFVGLEDQPAWALDGERWVLGQLVGRGAHVWLRRADLEERGGDDREGSAHQRVSSLG
jgi:hypothetical protein